MGKGIQGHVGITGMTGMTEMRELERPEQKRSKANGIFPMAQHDIQQQQQAVMTPERENHHGLPLVIALNCLEDCRLEVEALSGVAEFRHVGLTQVTEGNGHGSVVALPCLPSMRCAEEIAAMAAYSVSELCGQSCGYSVGCRAGASVGACGQQKGGRSS